MVDDDHSEDDTLRTMSPLAVVPEPTALPDGCKLFRDEDGWGVYGYVNGERFDICADYDEPNQAVADVWLLHTALNPSYVKQEDVTLPEGCTPIEHRGLWFASNGTFVVAGPCRSKTELATEVKEQLQFASGLKINDSLGDMK